jgi:beta-glucanase (GH16 family)
MLVSGMRKATSQAPAGGSRVSARRAATAAAILALVGVASALAARSPRRGPDRAPALGSTHWHRVFADEFRHGLSRARWGRYSGQPAGDPGGWWDPSHVVVRRGILNLETYRDPRFGGRWVSGGVSSARALKQRYGKYLVRFRVDRGKGIAAVLLLFPSADHWPPEIDFAESGGITSARTSMAATLHYGSRPDDHQIQRIVHGDFTRWHTIGVEWTPRRLAYTLDGRRWAVLRSAHVPDEPMELDLQAQAGTCGDRYAPCPDASTPRRVTLQVDRVIAYAYRPGDG